jgi:hypothetical protein
MNWKTHVQCQRGSSRAMRSTASHRPGRPPRRQRNPGDRDRCRLAQRADALGQLDRNEAKIAAAITFADEAAAARAEDAYAVEQDQAVRRVDAGALFMTSAMPEFSAYLRACCDCGFDAFAVPVNKHIRHFPDTKRPNPTFSSAATQNPGL